MKVNQLKAGVVLSYISMGIGNLIQILYTPFMLRILGTSEYGLYNLANSVISYLGLLSFGFGSAYIRYYSRYKVRNDKEDIAKLNGMFLIIYSIIGVVSIITGGILVANIENLFVTGLTSNEIVTARILMIIMVINLAISFPASVFSSNVTANEKYIFQRGVDILRKILNPFLTLPLLLLGYKSISIVVVTTILTIMCLILNIWYCIKALKMRFIFKKINLGLMKEMWVFSFYIFLNMIIDQINWNLDNFIVGVFRGTTGVAIYSIGAQFNSYYVTFSNSISSVFIPKINRMVIEDNDDNLLTQLFVKVGRIQFIVLSYILLIFIFFGKFFISIWAGSGYEDSYIIALILMIPVTIPLVQNLGIEIQRAKNKHKFRSLMYLVIAVLNVILSIPLSKEYGGVGAAIGTAISLFIGNGIIMNIYYYRNIKLDIPYFWKEILKFTPTVLIGLVIGFFIRNVIGIDSIIKFIIFILIFSVIFAVSIWKLSMNQYEKNLVVQVINKIKIKRRK